MWIRDVIPKSLPGVRAILYGYESNLLGSKSFQSITDIAVTLIHHLKAGGWNFEDSKPLVFLAHSLGGIVLKSAVIEIANGRNNSVTSILDKIQGAIMFGVPNLGMEQGHLATLVEGQANEMLVQDLSRGNGTQYLREQNDQFGGICHLRRVRVFWAYETKLSPTLVVSSALTNLYFIHGFNTRLTRISNEQMALGIGTDLRQC